MSQVESKPKARRRDPYKVLKISRDATEEDIKRAYKNMARISHPDRHTTGKEEAAQTFIEGHEAYLMLMEERGNRRDKDVSKGSTAKESAKASPSHSDPSGSTLHTKAGPSSPQSDSLPLHVPVPQKASSGREYPKAASSRFDPRSPTPPPHADLPSPNPSTAALHVPVPQASSGREYPNAPSSRFDPRSPTPPPHVDLPSPGPSNSALDDPVPLAGKASSGREYPKAASSRFDPRSPTPPPHADLPSPNPSTAALHVPIPQVGKASSEREYPKAASSRFDPRRPTPPPHADLPSPAPSTQALHVPVPEVGKASSGREYPKAPSSRFDPRSPTPPPSINLPSPGPSTSTLGNSVPQSLKTSSSREYPKTASSRFDPRSPTPPPPAELPGSPASHATPMPASESAGSGRSSKALHSKSDRRSHISSDSRSSSSRSSSRDTSSKAGSKKDTLSPPVATRPSSRASRNDSDGLKNVLPELKINPSPSVSRSSSGSSQPLAADSSAHVPSKAGSVASDARSSSRSSSHRTPAAKGLALKEKDTTLSTRSKSQDTHTTRSKDTHKTRSSSEVRHQAASTHASEASRPSSPVIPGAIPVDTTKSSAPSARSRLQKRRKPEVDDDSEAYVHIVHARDVPTSPNGTGAASLPVDEEGNTEPVLHPIRSPRASPKEWIFPIDMTLEDLFHGTSLRFRVTRKLLSGKTKDSMIAIDLPPGTLSGRKIRCPGCGHQRKDESFQDVVFIIQEKPHDRFERKDDDLIMDVYVPYADRLVEDGGDITLEGIDGELIQVNIPYPDQSSREEGRVVVKGAGMPFRKGRGDLIVRWQVVSPNPTSVFSSRWGTFKKALHIHH